MIGIDRVGELGASEDGLAVVVTLRADGWAQASVVNAGVLEHPVTGEPVVGFVIQSPARKLANLRARPRVTVVFRSGREWISIEGDAQLAGPNDRLEGLDTGDLPRLLREVCATAVGGTPEDWAVLDETMAAEEHTAVLVVPRRIYSNPEGGG